MNQIKTRCCVVGGGPAGMMLGFLLARAGIEVLVLEKHADFFRDFRGDTIHPSTMELLHELGLLEEFLQLPHQKLPRLKLSIEGRIVDGPDCSHLPVRFKFIALLPHWDFLNFLASHANKFSLFNLKMKSEVTGLIFENEKKVVWRLRAREKLTTTNLKSALILSLERTDAIPLSAKAPVWNYRTLACRLTCCGFGCPSHSVRRIFFWVESAAVSSWSQLTVAIIFKSPSSSRKARLKKSSAMDLKHFGKISSPSRRNFAMW